MWTITSSALRAAIDPLSVEPGYAWLWHCGCAWALSRDHIARRRSTLPFALSSIALVLTTFGMISAERRLAAGKKVQAVSPRAFGSFTKAAAVFALGMIVLAFGYQIHFALESRARPASLARSPSRRLISRKAFKGS